MERELIRVPLLSFFLCFITGGLTSAFFPMLGWIILPVLAVALVSSIIAAFFTTRYTTYHRTVNSQLMLFYCFFMIMAVQTALESWLPWPGPVLLVCFYFVLLGTAYLFCYRIERRDNWHDFTRTLKSPTLVIDNGKVRRIVRARKAKGSSPWSSGVANIGAGLGVATVSVVGVVFGAKGKELLLLAVIAVFMVAPFFLLRYLVIYSVGIREVRKVERERTVRFEFDNVTALQDARRKIFFARLLNPHLRQEA
jgi:Ca2+/Na+ antiporter